MNIEKPKQEKQDIPPPPESNKNIFYPDPEEDRVENKEREDASGIEEKGGEGEERETVAENDLNKVRSEIESLAKNHYLLHHQTARGTAKRIVESAEYFGGSGLNGTVLLNQNAGEILSTFEDLDRYPKERKKLTHKGATALVIMAFPKELVEAEKNLLNNIDSALQDKIAEGKIKQLGLPGKFIFGYYNNGTFFKNKEFQPEF